MDIDIRDLYHDLIIDHGTQPRNCGKLDDANHSAEGFNPLCGDKIYLYLKIQNDRILAASFTGQGCAISNASASLMTETLVGKTLMEAQDLFNAFQQLLTSDSSADIDLGKLQALAGVRAFPARVKCATLAWHTLLSALKQSEMIVSTETV